MPKTTIIKSHTPKFEGDAPSDWVSGTVTRYKNDAHWRPWKSTARLGWLKGYTYEYEVEVDEGTPVEVLDDETLANRIFDDIKEMKKRGYNFSGREYYRDSDKYIFNLDDLYITSTKEFKGINLSRKP